VISPGGALRPRVEVGDEWNEEDELRLVETLVLCAGGLIAGVVNTLAGGGSLLTVPLLVMVGLPGNLANGSNRIGVLLQCITAAWGFRSEGIPGFRHALPLLLPLALGSLGGALAISHVADRTFERLFGIIMVLLLVPLLRRPRRASSAGPAKPRRWSAPVSFAVMLAIGLYGGAFQAGVGIPLLLALSHAGEDLVRANSIKVVAVGFLTVMAIPVFFSQGQIAWVPGLVIGAGFAAGGAVGARMAVRGGERIIRPVLTACVLALAARMLGLY